MSEVQEVPFFSLQEQSASIKKEVLEKIAAIIDSTAFVLGKELKLFEDNFANYCTTKYALGVSNGTAALLVALQTLGVRPNDEVIIPSATFTSTALAVVQLGAKPVFADISASTWTIDAKNIEQKISPRTKAVIAVHLYGNPCDMDAIVKICKQYNIFLIEDAAQAHGALFKEKKVGSFGDIACFSFYPSKNLGAMGDAGGITFQNDNYHELASGFRNCGKDKEGNHRFLGFNYRMDPFQSGVLNIKLPKLDIFNAKRRKIADFYKSKIKNDKVSWQQEQKGAKSVYHLFVLKVDDRELFTTHLKAHKVGYSFHYLEPVHLQPAYAYLQETKGDLPVTEDLYKRCTTIPLYPEMTMEQVQRVVDVINAY